MRAILTPPPRYTVSQWSERFRYLSREYSASPGRYDLSIVPYAREPLDCSNDPTVRSVVLMWASQTTKTTLLENVTGYFIHGDPAPVLMVQPTVEMAQAWSKERLIPTARDTPVLRDLIGEQKSRDSGNTIQIKVYPGGNLAIIGANAPAGLAARPRRVVLCDEVDRYPLSAGTEGDPVALAIRRTESFWNSVVYLTSTPTIKRASRIEKEFEETDQRRWFAKCPSCGHDQTLVWRQVKWPKTDNGGHDLENAYYECAGRGCRWNDELRVKAIQAGEWRATAPFKGKRGYHLNGIYSPFKCKRGFKSRLHQMAVDFMEARHGGQEQVKTWTNTFLAETFEEEGEQVEHGPLLARSEEYTPKTLPLGVLLVTASADVQKDRIELEAVGIGHGDESWGIEKVVIYGDTEQDEVWSDLADHIGGSDYQREDGVLLKITATAIDMRHKPKKVRDFCRKSGLPRVYPVYGVAGNTPILVTSRPHKRYRLRVFAVNGKIAKDTLFARLRLDNPGPRYMHFPRGHGYDEEHFRQLTGEVLKTKYLHGFPVPFYEKIRERNEALDLRVYWLACLDILNPKLQTIARLLRKPVPQNEDKPADKPEDKTQAPAEAKAPISKAARKPQMRQSNGWVGKWRNW